MPPERMGTSLECEQYLSKTFNKEKLEGAKPRFRALFRGVRGAKPLSKMFPLPLKRRAKGRRSLPYTINSPSLI